jgi:predicted RND superfamily exporter protein
VTDMVRGLQESNRRMQEEHIAYILKGIVKVGTEHNYIALFISCITCLYI